MESFVRYEDEHPLTVLVRTIFKETLRICAEAWLKNMAGTAKRNLNPPCLRPTGRSQLTFQHIAKPGKRIGETAGVSGAPSHFIGVSIRDLVPRMLVVMAIYTQ